VEMANSTHWKMLMQSLSYVTFCGRLLVNTRGIEGRIEEVMEGEGEGEGEGKGKGKGKGKGHGKSE